MSWRAVSQAYAAIQAKGDQITPPAASVLVALSHCHNQETGRCDPSLATLCDLTRLSERTVRSCLRLLEGLGLVATTHRTIRTGLGKRNLRNRYNLTGGATVAGGVGRQLPGNREIYPPSAFDDLAASIGDIDIPMGRGK